MLSLPPAIRTFSRRLPWDVPKAGRLFHFVPRAEHALRLFAEVRTQGKRLRRMIMFGLWAKPTLEVAFCKAKQLSPVGAVARKLPRSRKKAIKPVSHLANKPQSYAYCPGVLFEKSCLHHNDCRDQFTFAWLR
jgi:hypothetical protein